MTNETARKVDYREAFVADMEMAAHGPNCQQCSIAALRGDHDGFCLRMQHLREVVKMAYEALPPYYKERYNKAVSDAVAFEQQVQRDHGVMR